MAWLSTISPLLSRCKSERLINNGQKWLTANFHSAPRFMTLFNWGSRWLLTVCFVSLIATPLVFSFNLNPKYNRFHFWFCFWFGRTHVVLVKQAYFSNKNIHQYDSHFKSLYDMYRMFLDALASLRSKLRLTDWSNSDC